MTNDPGPACRTCAQTEARCAYLGTCCGTATCTHWKNLDANGNERAKKPTIVIRLEDRPTCTVCGRYVSPRGRFDCPGLCTDVRRSYDRQRARDRRTA